MKHRMKWLLALFICICMFMSGTVYAQEQGTEPGGMEAAAGERAEKDGTAGQTAGNAVPNSTEASKAGNVKAGGVAVDVANFPDEKFRSYVNKFDADGDGVLSAEEIDAVKSISTSFSKGNNSSPLTGIEYFTSLKDLTVTGIYDQLHEVDLSKNVELRSVRFFELRLKKLDISKNVNLESLECDGCDLKMLDVSKNMNLTHLSCGGNSLGDLDVSKNEGLTYLYCNSNQLKTLDVSKNAKLERLYCAGNQLKTLDVSKNVKLEELYCGNNQLKTLDVSKNVKLTTLICVRNSLEDLDVSKNANLASLSCGDNQLKTLDISKNANLASLSCGDNQLKTLDISKNANLASLSCGDNQLKTLDVSKNANLASLSCGDNQLKTLDVSENANLASLSCGDNQLKTLDVSKNAKLITLICVRNSLEDLDVSKNEDLTYLYCNGNPLKILDVSKNAKLEELYCKDTQLTSLDIRNGENPPLRVLDVRPLAKEAVQYTREPGQFFYGNNVAISKVDFPDVNFLGYVQGFDKDGNGMLSTEEIKDVKEITVEGKYISDLIGIEHFISLERLSCSGNTLTSLDVSKNVNLKRLDCSSNKLTSLDIRNCTALEYLDVRPLAKTAVQYTQEPSEFYYGDVKPDGEGTSEANASNLFGAGKSLRVAGLERVETSMMAADSLKKCQGIEKFENIIVACGSDYPDALTGSYLAKVKKAPMLLVQPTKASEGRVKAYVSSNLKNGGTVYILGGTGVVSKRFENSLGSLNTERLHGDNRYMTNLAILKEAGASNEELIVCSGQNYADSLSASAAGKPIMLAAGSLSSAQAEYLGSLSPKDIYVIGGVGAVSSQIEKDCRKYADVARVYGDDRYKTSVAVAKEFFNSRCGNAVLARAYDFPDGLSGGPLAMSIGAPLLLVENTAYQDAAEYAGAAGISRAVVLGGPRLISNKVVENILQ